MRSYHLMWIAGAGLLILGVFREETANILANAAMLCFSCIGLG